MRIYATIAALASAVTIASAVSAPAFAEANNTNNQSQTSNKPAQVTVTVQTGDNLSAIANKYQTTYVRIFDANSQISNPDLIYPGQVLTIPAANALLPNRTLPSETADADQATAPAPAPAPSPAPAEETDQSAVVQSSAPAPAPAVSGGSIWDQLAQCESGGNWSIDTGNGFYGGLQFTLSSWQSVGGSGYPNQASRNEQIQRAQMLQARQGWGAWPVCSAKIGL